MRRGVAKYLLQSLTAPSAGMCGNNDVARQNAKTGFYTTPSTLEHITEVARTAYQ